MRRAYDPAYLGGWNCTPDPQDDPPPVEPAPVYVCCKCLEPCDLHETGWSAWSPKLSACCRADYRIREVE